MKPKVFSLEKINKIFAKKNQNGNSKKLVFQNHKFSIFFSENFMDWSSGSLVELNDAKGIDVA